jgi:hypothetical protein
MMGKKGSQRSLNIARREKPLEKPRRLTMKQQIFVEGVLRHGNATKAAREAGYKHPNVRGAQNLVKLSISKTLQQRRGETVSAPKIDIDYVSKFLARFQALPIKKESPVQSPGANLRLLGKKRKKWLITATHS